MNVIVSLVSKVYDVERISQVKDLPSIPIYVAGKAESEAKIKAVIKENKYIVYDSEDDFDYGHYLNYINSLGDNDKVILNMSNL